MKIITISRGSFAGGKAVAEAVGHRLGIAVLGRESVLARAAKDYGISEEELTQALDAPPSFWSQVLGHRSTYVKCVTAVLLEYAGEEGNLVYHGNVGHLLLFDLSHVLRVRVVADMDFRIRAAMEKTTLGREGAVSYILRVDRERARWAQLLYGVDWEDPTQYHVLLNVSRLSANSAAETIARMSELEEFKPTPGSRKRFEDLRLSCRVWGALAKLPETRSESIQVTADDGEVVISGKVSSAKALEMIPRVAETVEGVKALRVEAVADADWIL